MSEERAKRLVDNWKHGFKTRIREAVLAEREAILKTLRLLKDEHCTHKKEAEGVQVAIDCIRARG